VNAGKVKVRVTGESYCKDYSADLAYYETLKLSAKVKPDTGRLVIFKLEEKV